MAVFRKEKEMPYFNYHAVAKQLIADGKLTGFYYTNRHNSIAPALVLLFDDFSHPIMPIRQDRWKEYQLLLQPEREQSNNR